MGDDPGKHPCHEEFYEAVGTWMEAFIRTSPDGERVMAAAEWIISAAADHRGEDCFWWLFAAQGHVRPLVRYLAPRDCERLLSRYAERYSKGEMLPLQRELVKMLGKRAKQ